MHVPKNTTAFRLVCRLAWALFAGFSLLIGLARFGPRQQPEWLAFLPSPDEACAMPCWHGIRPGQTRADEAIRLLRAHPLSGRVVTSYYNRVNGDGVIVWVVDAGNRDDARGPLNARLRARNHRIVNITLSSGLLAGDALLALGQPTGGMTRIVQTLRAPPFRVEQSYVYADASVQVTSRARCPFIRADLWQARAMVEFGEPDVTYSIEPVVQTAAYAGYPPPTLWREQTICR